MDDNFDRVPCSTPVLVVGDWCRVEMSDVRRWIAELGETADTRHVLVLPASDSPTDDAWCPALVIVCQSWPDEFPARIVASCLGRWPLAQWVCCYGDWCDSDGRTRTIWPISVRVPAHAAIPRLEHVWNIIHDGDSAPLPLTASRDETFAFDNCR